MAGMDPGRLLRDHPDGVQVAVWVVAGAAASEITGLHGETLRVRVSAPAEAGKANRAAAALVARALGGRRGQVIAGATARRKQVLVHGLQLEEATRHLRRLLARGPDTP